VSQIPEPGVRVRGLRKGFGERPVLEPLDLDLEAGSIVSVIGPSGCGKTTLLRMLAGLESPDTGTVYLGGSTPDEARRAKKVAVVPQQPGLLPWRTVEANARLLLDVGRSASPSGSTSPADPVALLHEVGLGDVLDHHPHQLSGGMQQRVALVRALALHAPLLLLDEPFAALDEITRAEMRYLLARMVEGRGATVVLVTHSISEAVALGDRVLVLSPRPGRLVADIHVDLPRPRTAGIDDDPRFVERCSQVRRALHEAGGLS
jgi:NitT/TauT family transport system ATP-binding protein